MVGQTYKFTYARDLRFLGRLNMHLAFFLCIKQVFMVIPSRGRPGRANCPEGLYMNPRNVAKSEKHSFPHSFLHFSHTSHQQKGELLAMGGGGIFFAAGAVAAPRRYAY